MAKILLVLGLNLKAATSTQSYSYKTIKLKDGAESLFGTSEIGGKGNLQKDLELFPSREPRRLVAEDALALGPIAGHCFSYNDTKYTYDFCPFHNKTQVLLELKLRALQ